MISAALSLRNCIRDFRKDSRLMTSSSELCPLKAADGSEQPPSKRRYHRGLTSVSGPSRQLTSSGLTSFVAARGRLSDGPAAAEVDGPGTDESDGSSLPGSWQMKRVGLLAAPQELEEASCTISLRICCSTSVFSRYCCVAVRFLRLRLSRAASDISFGNVHPRHPFSHWTLRNSLSSSIVSSVPLGERYRRDRSSTRQIPLPSSLALWSAGSCFLDHPPFIMETDYLLLHTLLFLYLDMRAFPERCRGGQCLRR